MRRAREGAIRTQNRIWPQIAHGMPVRALVTRGAAADRARAIAPIDGFAAEKLLANRGRDTDEILVHAERPGMEAVIPPKKSRGERRDCDREPCRARHPIGTRSLI